jgi:hypothetical protein
MPVATTWLLSMCVQHTAVMQPCWFVKECQTTCAEDQRVGLVSSTPEVLKSMSFRPILGLRTHFAGAVNVEGLPNSGRSGLKGVGYTSAPLTVASGVTDGMVYTTGVVMAVDGSMTTTAES